MVYLQVNYGCGRARHVLDPPMQQLPPMQQQHRLPALVYSRQQHTKPVRLFASPDGDAAGASSDSSSPHSTQPPHPATTVEIAGPPADQQSRLSLVLDDAKYDFYRSLQQLKDTAGVAFVPGYRPTSKAVADSGDSSSNRTSSSRAKEKRKTPRFTTYARFREVAVAKQRAQEEQQQEEQQQLLLQQVQSIPDRLGRILTGKFIDRTSARTRQRNQAFDARKAAVQFELQAQVLDQAQQQQQQDSSAATAQASNARSEQIIDMLPDGSAVTDEEPSPYKAALAAAAAAAEFTDPAAASAAMAAAAEDEPVEPYPAATNVLVAAMWAVFVLQWWPVLPEVWLTAQKVGPLQALAAVLLAYPDTPVTQALQLDFAAVQKGSLSGLITSGFLHSGLAATWLCTRALYSCSRFLEIGLGPVQLFSIFFTSSVCSSVAHVLAGRSMVAVCGSGAVIGVFTTWTLLARRFLQQQIPMWIIYLQLGSLVGLNLLLGMIQPAVGVASILGGMVGGALAVSAAGPIAVALQWAITLPVLASLFILKLMFDAVKGLLTVGLVATVFVTQLGSNVIQTVRRV